MNMDGLGLFYFEEVFKGLLESWGFIILLGFIDVGTRYLIGFLCLKN